MSEKQVLNDILQGSVATYLRCGGLLITKLKRFIAECVSEKNIFKSVNIWQSYQQERDCLVHFLRLLAVCWPGAQSA